MQLSKYMELHGLTVAEFARLLGVTEPAVRNYLRGRVPRPDVMRRIVEITGGAVRPDDFYLRQEEVRS